MNMFAGESVIEEERRLVQKALDQIAAGEYLTLSSAEDIKLFVAEIAQRSAERRKAGLEARQIDRNSNA